MIRYSLKIGGIVHLSVYDLLGREVTVLVNNERKTTGQYRVLFDAANFPSGVYFYTLQAQNYTETKRMVFIK